MFRVKAFNKDLGMTSKSGSTTEASSVGSELTYPTEPGVLPNPYDNANLVDYLVFGWPRTIIKLGSMRPLEQKDLPDVSRDDDVRKLGRNLTYHWQRELDACVNTGSGRPSLTRALFRAHGPSNWFVGLILCCESALRIYQAQILGRLINFLLTPKDEALEGVYNNGYFLSFLLILLGASVAFMHHHAFFHAWRLGMQLRGALTTVIYDKAIKLSLQSMASISVGHIVNLSAQDVESFQICGCFIHFSYQPILEAAAVLYFGINLIGVSFVAGFACIILLIPLQKVFSTQLSKSKGATSKYTDERLKMLNQALNGVRLMKINAWEGIFISIIEGMRKKEVASLLYTNIMRGLNEAIFFAMPIMIAAFTFITYVRLGNVLTTPTIFIVLTYFNIVQFSMTKFFSMSIASITECQVAIGRIERLLMLPEVPDAGGSTYASALSSSAEKPSAAIAFSNFSASWTQEQTTDADVPVEAGKIESGYLSITTSSAAGADAAQEENSVAETAPNIPLPPTPSPSHTSPLVLSNITLTIARGELVVVVGRVGSGKSSLLLAALGELPACPNPDPDSSTGLATTGYARVSRGASGKRSLAFCAQTPFVMSSTVKENILFSSPFDAERYQRCLSLCALQEDLQSFSHGDATVIGDKGINLSGGQKARVGLCRAMYSNRDTYLLDDPLSAVDTHVGAALFESICSMVKAGKTVLLATHQVQYLKSPAVTRVVVMDKGRVVGCGTYDELIRTDGVAGYLLGHEEEEDGGSEKEEGEVDVGCIGSRLTSADEPPDPPTRRRQASQASQSSQHSASAHTHTPRLRKGSQSSAHSADYSAHSVGKKGELDGEDVEIAGITVDEDKASGSVQLSTYIQYGKSMGGAWTVLGLTGIMAAAQVLSILANYWLSLWSRASSADQQNLYFINSYVGIVVAAVFASILRAIVVFAACIHASQRLHNRLLSSVINTKILFFDSNPIGRILNRFAKDVAFTDDLLPNTLYDCLQCVLMCFGAILVVCSAVPYIFISLIPLLVFFYRLRGYFLKTSREVKRLESLSRSPIFSHLTESLDGVITIRAFDMVPPFCQHNKALLNSNVRGYFIYVATARWLGFNLDATVIGLLLASTFGAVLAKAYNAGINNTAIVVGIMYVIQLTGLFQWAVRQTAEVESIMVSVERILAYSDLEPEGRLHGPADVGSGTLIATYGQLSASASHDAEVPKGPAGQEQAQRKRPNWPETGRIDCVNLTASYRAELPPVLQNVTFSLPPGARVGIVGRSGCGKSTLVSTLLRLVDITGGGIFIDGVDITTIGLHDLRPKISVIQQNPFLFSGTIRQNLDPWGRYSDADIWAALECVCLKAFVQRCEMLLEHPIEEGGQNFSTGERQLVCLARAILQRNQILIMDEATANIDNETDQVRSDYTLFSLLLTKVALSAPSSLPFLRPAARAAGHLQRLHQEGMHGALRGAPPSQHLRL